MKELQEHQKRVLEEHKELCKKIEALIKFVQSDLFQPVETSEQGRLQRQLSIMQDYRDILFDRINNF